MPLITSSLKTMRIHSRPPAAFLQAYREAFEIGEVTFGFVRQFPRGRVAFAGLYCEIDSDDKENEDDIKIVKADHDEDRMALVLMAHGEELQRFLSDISSLFSFEEPDYILISASADEKISDFAKPTNADSVGDEE
jgi:hypothetical protein